MKLALYILAVFVTGASVPEAESFTTGMIMLVLFIVSVALTLSELASSLCEE
jgi:hypothetical protein